MLKRVVQAVAIVAVAGSLSACVTSVETDQRLTLLEERVNAALQNAAAAKIDSATALMIATEGN